MAGQLQQALDALKALPANEVQNTWASLEPKLKPFLMLTVGLLTGQQPAGMEHVAASAQQMVRGIFRRGELSFTYDPVSFLSTPWGFKHPLVDFQPMAHPVKGMGSSMAKVPANFAATLPKFDTFQALFGSLANGTRSFPNHNLCCYTTDTQCSSKFTVQWQECKADPLR